MGNTPRHINQLFASVQLEETRKYTQKPSLPRTHFALRNTMLRTMSSIIGLSTRVVKVSMRVGACARTLSTSTTSATLVGVGSATPSSTPPSSLPSSTDAKSIAAVGTSTASTDSARTGAFGLRFEVGRIEAVRRETVGKRSAQWTRMNGLVPGLIYGPGVRGDNEPIRVYVTEADLRAVVNKSRGTFLNTLFDIVVDGVATRVLVRDFQMHPFKPKFISCNWFRYRPGRYPGVKVDLPLRAINEERCPAFKDGGWLLELIHKLPVFASGDEIPDAVVYDLRGKRMGEKVMASDIVLSGGLSLVSGWNIYHRQRRMHKLFLTNFLLPNRHPHPTLLLFFSQRVRDQDFAVAKFVGSKRSPTDVAEAAAAAPVKKDEKNGDAKKAAEAAK